MLGSFTEAFEACKHQKAAAHKAKHHTVGWGEFNPNTPQISSVDVYFTYFVTPKHGNSATDDSLSP
jgi:hypothetical protein